MIVLDTNVLSAVMRPESDARVLDWLDRQPPDDLWTTAISVFEIAYGIELMANGRRRQLLQEAFARALEDDLDGRVLTFDRSAAHESGRIAARQKRSGRPVEFRDLEIAGIVLAHGAVLATRNVRHFDRLGIEVRNPWEGA